MEDVFKAVDVEDYLVVVQRVVGVILYAQMQRLWLAGRLLIVEIDGILGVIHRHLRGQEALHASRRVVAGHLTEQRTAVAVNALVDPAVRLGSGRQFVGVGHDFAYRVVLVEQRVEVGMMCVEVVTVLAALFSGGGACGALLLLALEALLLLLVSLHGLFALTLGMQAANGAADALVVVFLVGLGAGYRGHGHGYQRH